MSVTKINKTLTVTKREVFYDDSFFQDSWDDFDNAMKSILNKFETDDSKTQDVSNRTTRTNIYRKIRTTNIEKDLYQSQALQVTEKDGNFQCVMDVKDFNPNDLQVKVVDDRVVVDGKFEKTSEDGLSKTSKSFHKEFTLPNAADIVNVATALSRDGVLTIKAPKRDLALIEKPSGTVATSQTSSVQESSTSSNVQDGSSSVQKSTKTQQSFSSTSSSTFSSTKKSSVTSSVKSSELSSLTDDSEGQDRLVFTHDNVNIKLPAAK